MIRMNKTDREKYDRIRMLSFKTDFDYLAVPFTLLLACAFIIWMDISYLKKPIIESSVFIVFGILVLVWTIFSIRERQKARKEVKQLKEEIGL